MPAFEFTDLAGARASGAASSPSSIAKSAAPVSATEGLELAATPAIYRTDGVVRRAQALQEHPLNLSPRITLNPVDAEAAGVAEGAIAKVAAADGTATLPVFLDTRVAHGAAWIESGHGATAPLGAGNVTVVGA